MASTLSLSIRFAIPRRVGLSLRATVYPSKNSSGFVGYGDADPSNVSFPVQGAEMSVAETRAVNRALRKAYGIGICSVEEIGALTEPPSPSRVEKATAATRQRKRHGRTVRDRLCQSFASTNWIPTWSRPMRLISAA